MKRVGCFQVGWGCGDDRVFLGFVGKGAEEEDPCGALVLLGWGDWGGGLGVRRGYEDWEEEEGGSHGN